MAGNTRVCHNFIWIFLSLTWLAMYRLVFMSVGLGVAVPQGDWWGQGNTYRRAAATVDAKSHQCYKVQGLDVNRYAVLFTRTSNGHGLSNNAIAAHKECTPKSPTVST